MKRLICLLALVTVGCSARPTSATPVTPAPTPAPACQLNNTAAAKFGNRTTTATTYDVFWDGVRITTITPGQDSPAFDVTAGIPHRMEFRVTNSPLLACNVANPVPTQCAFPLYTCTF